MGAESLWSIVDAQDYADLELILDPRQRKLVEGAINYHSLVNPGAELTYRVYLSLDEEYPRLTDTSTLTGDWVEDMEPLGEFRVRSKVKGKVRKEPAWDDRDQKFVEAGDVRYLRVSPTVSNDAKARVAEILKPKQKLYNFLERHNTELLDVIREVRIRKNEMRLGHPIARHKGDSFFGNAKELKKFTFKKVRPIGPRADAPQALLFGLHWLQTGGAERWAFESIQIAKDQGLLPIVITDQLSHQYWITRPELEGALLLPLTIPLQRWHGDEPLLRFLSETYQIRGIMLHHCAWLYACLPWFNEYMPEIPVVDSLHIIEYSGGGYPGLSAHCDNFVDLHHVISPRLSEWMIEKQKIDPKKVVLAPLVGLTTNEDVDFKERVSADRFRVAFIGRLARQKRPDVFLAAAEKLNKKFPDVDFILHGSGELEPLVDRQLSERGLEGVVERRTEETPVSQTLADSDLLVLTSTNEGLALTVFEAVAAGVPVISTRVGSQETLVPDDALMDRAAARLVRQISPLVATLKDNEEARRDLWQRERRAVQEFSKLSTATQWTTEWMKGLVR